jgi:hypothetical protein
LAGEKNATNPRTCEGLTKDKISLIFRKDMAERDARQSTILAGIQPGRGTKFFDNNHDDEKGKEEKESRKKFSVSCERSRRKNRKLIFKRLYFMALLSVR